MHPFKKHLFMAVLILSTSFPVMAAAVNVSAKDIKSIDVSSLTDEQKTQLMSQAVQLQKEQPALDAANMSETVRTEASKWADLGSNVGKAAVSAAKELGVAANDFVQTPLGKITMGIVIFKVIGSSLIHLIVGLIVLLTGLSIAIYLILKKKYHSVEYENATNGWGTKKTIKAFTVDEDLTETHFIGACVSAAIGVVIGCWIIFTM